MTATETTVCIACRGPREIDPAKSKPGIVAWAEIHYRPCPACGEIGILRQDDKYQPGHGKKGRLA